jgi:branched-chain amino acid aminotransferase
MRPVVSVNGVVTGARDAVVPVYDHGFLYGEGVYETLRTYRGEPFLFGPHFERLLHSAGMMNLRVPFSQAELLASVRETMRVARGESPDHAHSDAYIRILLTRGVGELTYSLAACPVPTVVIIVKPYVAPADRTFTEGIRLAIVSVRRNHPSALNPMMKSNNLINNALAMQEALAKDAEEALMLNQAGEIVECSQSNVFIVRDGGIVTPPIEAGLLPGITRQFVMDLAAGVGIQAREAHLRPDELIGADEAFITGTTREVTPVVAVDDKVIGRGRPGPVTTRLQAAFSARAIELTPASA